MLFLQESTKSINFVLPGTTATPTATAASGSFLIVSHIRASSSAIIKYAYQLYVKGGKGRRGEINLREENIHTLWKDEQKKRKMKSS